MLLCWSSVCDNYREKSTGSLRVAGQDGKAKEVGNSQAEVPGYGWGSERQDQTPLSLTGQEGETGQWLPLQKNMGQELGLKDAL